MDKVAKTIKELKKICSEKGNPYISLNGGFLDGLEDLIENDKDCKSRVENIAMSLFYDKHHKYIEIEELKEKHYDTYFAAVHMYVFDLTAIGENTYSCEELIELLEDDSEYLEDVEIVINQYYSFKNCWNGWQRASVFLNRKNPAYEFRASLIFLDSTKRMCLPAGAVPSVPSGNL